MNAPKNKDSHSQTWLSPSRKGTEDVGLPAELALQERLYDEIWALSATTCLPALWCCQQRVGKSKVHHDQTRNGCLQPTLTIQPTSPPATQET